VKLKIYLAAPLFTREERGLNLKLAKMLSVKYEVYLPQRDGILLEDEVKRGEPIDSVKDIIFQSDCNAIKDCDIVFCVLNGRTVDEGVSFELGYGYALGKTCWSYKEDWRTLLKHGDNPMIEGSIEKKFNTLEELIDYIKK